MQLEYTNSTEPAGHRAVGTICEDKVAAAHFSLMSDGDIMCCITMICSRSADTFEPLGK